jgi:hypothetical protein
VWQGHQKFLKANSKHFVCYKGFYISSYGVWYLNFIMKNKVSRTVLNLKKQLEKSAQCDTARTRCPHSASLRGYSVRAVDHWKYMDSGQWCTAGTSHENHEGKWCPRNSSLWRHGVCAVHHCKDMVCAQCITVRTGCPLSGTLREHAKISNISENNEKNGKLF